MHTLTHSYKDTPIHSYTYTPIHPYAYAFIHHTVKHSFIHTPRIHTLSRSYTHLLIHPYTTRTLIHPYTHSYTHTFIHSSTQQSSTIAHRSATLAVQGGRGGDTWCRNPSFNSRHTCTYIHTYPSPWQFGVVAWEVVEVSERAYD